MSADTLNNLLAEPSPSGQSFVNPRYTAFTQAVRNFRLTSNASKDVPRVIPKSHLYGYLDLIASEQIRAARAMLRMTVVELSAASGVGVATIKRLEAVDGLPPANARTLVSLQEALIVAGVEFLGSHDQQPGVRLKSAIPKRVKKQSV